MMAHVYKPVSLQERQGKSTPCRPVNLVVWRPIMDIANTTHPGMATVLVTPDNPIET